MGRLCPGLRHGHSVLCAPFVQPSHRCCRHLHGPHVCSDVDRCSMTTSVQPSSKAAWNYVLSRPLIVHFICTCTLCVILLDASTRSYGSFFFHSSGFVVDAVMEKMNDLRKGKSAVKEWDHTLLIGWTDRSIAFISQICLANESSGGAP